MKMSGKIIAAVSDHFNINTDLHDLNLLSLMHILSPSLSVAIMDVWMYLLMQVTVLPLLPFTNTLFQAVFCCWSFALPKFLPLVYVL